MKPTSKSKAASFIATDKATALSVRRLRGILKPKPGGKPFADEWAEHKREVMQSEKVKT
jgi:hypothetical protein